MQPSLHSRRYTLHVKQQSYAFELTWDIVLLRADDTLVYHAQKTCTHAELTDGLAALACAIPGLTVIYDESRVDKAA